MNGTQRKFLVEKIQEETKKQIQKLKNKKEEFPNASNYVFKAIMTDTLRLKPESEILAAIKKLAVNSKQDRNWLTESSFGFEKSRGIKLVIDELIEIPDDLYAERDRVKAINSEIEKQIEELESYLNTLEVRIMLASDKTLLQIINDVDDMGDIKLIDSNLKLLNK